MIHDTDNTDTEELEYIKFLGIHLDEELTSRHHNNSLCKIMPSNNDALRDLEKWCPNQKRLILIDSFIVFPHHSYGVA